MRKRTENLIGQAKQALLDQGVTGDKIDLLTAAYFGNTMSVRDALIFGVGRMEGGRWKYRAKRALIQENLGHLTNLI